MSHPAHQADHTEDLKDIEDMLEDTITGYSNALDVSQYFNNFRSTGTKSPEQHFF
jgi:hypothetical protein